jgi:hypothetical protein
LGYSKKDGFYVRDTVPKKYGKRNFGEGHGYINPKVANQ